MNRMIRNALRNNIGLRHQLEKNLLGDKGDVWEREFNKFLRQEECWVKKVVKKKAAETYPITVNYAMTLEQMIVAGKYDREHYAINSKNFVIKGEGKPELKPQLIHFNYDISSDVAEAKLDKLDLRPANLEELLAFGATYRDLQKKFPIVALRAETSIFGNRCVAGLDYINLSRRLHLYCRTGFWYAHCRFLALPKFSGA